MVLKTKILGVGVTLLLFTACGSLSNMADRSVASSSKSWPEQMQELANNLRNSFPFIYSTSEFKNNKNKKTMVKSFDQYINSGHELPEAGGRNYIGDEPLINEAKSSFSGGFAEAKKLYLEGQFAQSQKLIHANINRCFACHTAHQVGPTYPPSGGEISGIYTGFRRAKVVTMGALREFGAALDWIESQMQKKNRSLSYSQLGELHMIISLRAIQDFKRAEKFLNKLKPKLGKKDKDKISVWQKDLALWKNGKSPQKGKSSKSHLVRNLHNSYVLHKTIANKKMTAINKAKVYKQLSQVYKAIQVEEFAHLPEIYWKACKQVDEKICSN